jgi:hypothetical protein
VKKVTGAGGEDDADALALESGEHGNLIGEDLVGFGVREGDG